MAHDVFISHSSKDKPAADAVCAVLEAQGIRCWVAPRDIIPGRDWGESIVDAIKGARVMVLIFSANANNSPQIKREVERAANKGIPIIPLRIEDVVPTASLEYFLSTPHWLDAFTPPLESHLQHLAQVVRQIVGVAPAETSPISVRAVGAVAPEKTGAQKAAPVRPGRFKPAWLAAAAAFALLLCVGGWYFGMHLASARGGLIITTSPPGAQVAVGGFAVDKSPLTLKEVKLGSYPVVIRLPAYEDETRQVEVKEDQFTTLDVALVRSTGAAQIVSDPAGLAFVLAGAGETERGTTPAKIERLPTGDYTLTVTRDGWPEQKQTVTVVRNQTASALAEFVGGGLEITSTPAGAEVWAQGKRLGATPLSLTEVIPGSFDLEFLLEGYQNAAARVAVKPKETARANVTLDRQRHPVPGQAWENTLGLRFVPVPGTRVLFSIWDTRVQDFEAFVQATGYNAEGGMHSDRGDGWKQQGDTWKSPGFPQVATCPVVGVSWDDAQAFCRWLTAKERAEGRLGPEQEYRLPTDAEWSVAVGLDEPAGGTPQSKDGQIKDIYPWGTQWPPLRGAGNYADEAAKRGRYPNWTIIPGYDDGYEATSPVAIFTANRFGLFDMGGDVWQWCEDYYNGSSGHRVLRGGAFCDYIPGFLLSSFRLNSGDPVARASFVGFRCVVAVSAP
jgi:formylglycine-generating enzyme required for sulfatase activity